MLERINNTDAERAMLAAVMTDYAKLKDSFQNLTTEHFADSKNIAVFKAIQAAVAAGEIPDRPTVYEYLSPEAKKGKGGAYLQELYFTGETIEHPENTIKVLERNKIKRDYANILVGAIEKIADGTEPAEAIDGVLLQTKKMDNRKAEVIELGTMYLEVLSDIEKIKKGEKLGTRIGFDQLDDAIGGFNPGELVIVAGRPGTGKSQLCFQFACNMAKQGKNILMFSIEMSAKQLYIRYLANQTEIEKRKIRRAELSPEEVKLLLTEIQNYKNNIMIDDSGLSRISHIVKTARIVNARNKLDMVIVDHLQLTSIDGRDVGRTTELDEITRQLKLLAKELEVPVFALSQLSRKCEERPNKRPMQSDLRESGGIEQNADIILGIYHDRMYNPNTEKQGIAEVIILKAREEGVGTIELLFRPEIVKFKPYYGGGNGKF